MAQLHALDIKLLPEEAMKTRAMVQGRYALEGKEASLGQGTIQERVLYKTCTSRSSNERYLQTQNLHPDEIHGFLAHLPHANRNRGSEPYLSQAATGPNPPRTRRDAGKRSSKQRPSEVKKPINKLRVRMGCGRVADGLRTG